MLTKLFARKKKARLDIHPEFTPLIETIEQYVQKTEGFHYYEPRLPLKNCVAYDTLKNLPGTDKVDALLYLINRVNALHKVLEPNAYHTDEWNIYMLNHNLLNAFIRTRIEFPQDFSFLTLFKTFYHLSDHPFGALVSQIEKHIHKHGLSENLKKDLQAILDVPAVYECIGKGSARRYYYGPDIGKAVKKLQNLLYATDENGQSMMPPYQLGTGKFGSIVSSDLATLPQQQQDLWNALFHHLSTATTGKPAKKFLISANQLVDAIGTTQFKAMSNQWFTAAAHIAVAVEIHTHSYFGKEHSYETYEYIEAYSFNLLKGLLWTMSRFHNKHSLHIIALLTEKCFQKIPGQGPAAAGVGNAGIYTLAQSKGLKGISHLSRLKLRIRQNNTQKLIQKYIDEQARKQGIKPAQIEEISASDYGLCNGERIEAFAEYKLVLRLTAVGATELQWLKPDGKAQKSVPAFVKTNAKLSEKLKKLRDLAKQIKQASTTQRDRIDRLYSEDMSWSLADFETYYLNHGLVSQIACKLIWLLDEQPALFFAGQWQDEQGTVVTANAQTQVRLWHPIDSEANTVLAWRECLEVLQIKQPLKQAYREIYLLTDAEINTRIYSNRMAAHILKQHQFNSLAALRGWKYSLLGAYDDGRDGEIAQKTLPEQGLTAQFWIDEILDGTESFNDTGIWYYVATDQIRFCNSADQAVALVDVPALILSEIMRDVDLFVGVASVGNDPQWQDGGPDGRQDYRDYWQSYSFGDLSEVAKTRKTVLERLLPRLKIRDVAKIDGKFLMIQGKKHAYKIHIGSGNILIAPHDRYLCIVPGRGKDKNVDQLFLPFEGDNGLSIVLSKAFMLADDDKITDTTILSQL
ncbi:MAG: DUF4132 domain-containing protein [Methyloprofundus sp.]|nr:DUF4132 domain-containing protein [Methyloprofundus sp.]